MLKYLLVISIIASSLLVNAQGNSIFGLWVEDATDLTFLASTDPTTGIITPIDTMNGIDGIVLQTGTINSQMLLYTFRYLANSGFGLLTLALNTGSVVYDVPSEYNVVGLKYGCDNLIYGLWKDSDEAYHFVSIDPSTGNQNDFGVIAGLSGIYFGTFSFDINNQWYMVRGIDINGHNLLYSIDSQSGAIVNTPISDDNVRGNEYDCVTQLTYGAWNDPVTDFEYFVSLDPLTGDFNLIDSLYTVSALISETYSLNHNTGQYTFAGLQGPAYHLFTVDVNTGAVVYDVPVADVITETDQLSCCGKPVSTNEVIQESFNIYPNPVDDYLTVEWNLSSTAMLKLFDLRGSEVFAERILEGILTINVQSMKPGFYFIQIVGGNQVVTIKLVKG